MRFYDDGVVGLSIEPMVGVVRLLEKPGSEDRMPAYVGSGSMVRASDDVVKLMGFSGRMSFRHQRLLAQALLEQDYRVMYVERADGGHVARGKVLTKGDFAGHIRVDLAAIAARIAGRG